MLRQPDEDVDAWARAVIGAAIEVHSLLGPGLLEALYEEALCVEMQMGRIPFARQVPVLPQDLDHVAIPDGVTQRNNPPVDLRAGAAMADIRVNSVGKIERRRAGRKLAQLAFRGENVDLVA